MTVWTLAFALALTLVAVDAHVCMLQPMQRGGVTAAINTAAAPECAWLSGPCGNTTWHAPSLQIRPVSPVRSQERERKKKNTTEIATRASCGSSFKRIWTITMQPSQAHLSSTTLSRRIRSRLTFVNWTRSLIQRHRVVIGYSLFVYI